MDARHDHPSWRARLAALDAAEAVLARHDAGERVDLDALAAAVALLDEESRNVY